MVNAAAQYRRALKKKLRCGSEIKKRLLVGFDQTLAVYLEERGEPTMDDLTAAFGPPEEMAEVLMAQVTPQEQKQHHRNMLISIFLAGVLAVVLLVFTFYIWFYKETGLTITNNAGEVDVSTTPTTYSDIGVDVP